MGRVRAREGDLVVAATSFGQGVATVRDLCDAALRYAAAVQHNREQRSRWETKHSPHSPR